MPAGDAAATLLGLAGAAESRGLPFCVAIAGVGCDAFIVGRDVPIVGRDKGVAFGFGGCVVAVAVAREDKE
jgi:hypothetical protein